MHIFRTTDDSEKKEEERKKKEKGGKKERKKTGSKAVAAVWVTIPFILREQVVTIAVWRNNSLSILQCIRHIN